MVFDITHLKKIRKQLNLTQHQFAQKAGMSQSMIAKIEAGRLDPTYSYVKKIEDVLALLTQHDERAVKDVMHKGVISVAKDDPVKKVIKILADHNISQVPVFHQGHVVGLITESLFLDRDPRTFATLQAKDLMHESSPVVAPTTRLSVVIQLLKFYPLVLVSSAGTIVGVVTKADILKSLQ